ncbi:MAG: DNA repair protein RadC [Alphaproteobacteria bacterium]|nr:DNA repair protein RadC [Alphaproteobacteria bacterium]
MKPIKKEQPHYIGHRARVRTKFFKDNGVSMADYELMEVLLMQAIPRRDVKEQAKDLISHFGSFSEVIHASNEALIEFGVSQSVLFMIKFVETAMIRSSWQRLSEDNRPIYKNLSYMIEYCRMLQGHKGHEELRIIGLDSGYHIIAEDLIQTGTPNAVYIEPRAIVEKALKQKASMVVMVHNHPGGKAEPSMADIKQTQILMDILNSLKIALYDHIIITKDSYYSFAENRDIYTINDQLNRHMKA